MCLAAGEYRDAESWARQLVDLSRQRLTARDGARGHTILARAALRQGRLPQAVEAATEALTVSVDAYDTWALAWVLAVGGQMAWVQGDASSAALLHAGAETIRTNIGFVHSAPRARELENQLVELRAALGSDTFNAAWQTGASSSKRELVGRARRVLSI